jgi:hypothetical protein
MPESTATNAVSYTTPVGTIPDHPRFKSNPPADIDDWATLTS